MKRSGTGPSHITPTVGLTLPFLVCPSVHLTVTRFSHPAHFPSPYAPQGPGGEPDGTRSETDGDPTLREKRPGEDVERLTVERSETGGMSDAKRRLGLYSFLSPSLHRYARHSSRPSVVSVPFLSAFGLESGSLHALRADCKERSVTWGKTGNRR